MKTTQILIGSLSVLLLALGGCQTSLQSPSSADVPSETFALTKTTPEQASALLSDLHLGTVLGVAEPNTISVSGSPAELDRVKVVLTLVDTNDSFVVRTLAPVALARTLPSNRQIADAVEGITIGTFAAPPNPRPGPSAIIDIHEEAVVAIVPTRAWPDVRAVVELGPEARRMRSRSARGELPAEMEPSATAPPSAGNLHSAGETQVVLVPDGRKTSALPTEGPMLEGAMDAAAHTAAADRDTSLLPSNGNQANARAPLAPSGENSCVLFDPSAAVPPAHAPETIRGVLRPSAKIDKGVSTRASAAVEVPLANGDEVLELSLPEKIELIQLLDLAGEYLHLDCVYDAEKIGRQMITLKLHSKIRSEVRVRDLYSLLETALRFKGLVMTRHEGNLVTIAPAAEALEIDPEMVDPNSGTLQTGDVVVMRVFRLQYVDVSRVMNLLQTMKLSVAVSAVPETQTLFVTCYAQRMTRVEGLVALLDRPGAPREFRFRQLMHSAAAALIPKVLSLAEELEGIRVGTRSLASPAGPVSPSTHSTPASGTPGTAALKETIFLDSDERTNRILMIGPEEQLQTVEGLIDTLDIPDTRSIRAYQIRNVPADQVVSQLAELGLLGGVASAARIPKPMPTGEIAPGPRDNPRVVQLAATNCLLIEGTVEQHAKIKAILAYLDVPVQDARALRVYPIQHVDAEEVVKKLQQFSVIATIDRPETAASKPAPAGATPASAPETVPSAEGLPGETPQVVVLEATNSLLVNATEAQHSRIQSIIRYTDIESKREMVPYEIYFLENQNPEQLAQVLGKLLHETVTSPDGKIEKVIAQTEEQVTIIPDKNTFSLIVRANRKDQDWIADLVQRLDKRRPQVLIDVTLVEITETEAFNYDLNLIASATDLAHNSGLTGNLTGGPNPITSADVTNRLTASGQSQFADFQSNSGDLTAFYGDKHINLLLQAMQTKNYGRILAKPKILVNDNEPGLIKTTDTTYVVKQSSIPVSSGAAGNDVTLVQTAVDYQSYEAGITLNITPHISQGDLLRLEIQLTRSDFRPTEDLEKPPDKTSSELKTTVFVPDASTIILGGLLRLSQNKGGAKVPLLGDIPLIGGLFRSISNHDAQNKLYIFVKTEIIRPAGALADGTQDLKALSEKNRQAFEKHELQFQNYQSWPGIKSKPVAPPKVLDAR